MGVPGRFESDRRLRAIASSFSAWTSFARECLAALRALSTWGQTPYATIR
eukprot:COSAG05_NODE_1027_length_6117_cov_7.351778_2_plen_50_part_00